MAFSARSPDVPIAQINVTPLVDVLLVLLVIVMITSPVITHKLSLDLPQAAPDAPLQAEPVRLAIHADGSMAWNEIPIDSSMLSAQFAVAARRKDGPKIFIDPADGVPYQIVAGVIASARRQGLDRIDFMDERR
ncbi:biopolymer transporter ExbD [Dyella soli]|uniref:Biopolymer transporter ExbD n=2 Tax=Dyella soli TaxID=522319 RepID=A0A4R0YTJ8_9GAMM|nr:biopolymer transporter ExbD [Dyella soli]